MKTIETLVIGAGQAGLAAAWHLKKNQVNFLILEATNQIGGSWHHYYDSLKLFSPAAYSSLPSTLMPFLFILLLRQVGHLICSVIFIPLFYQKPYCFFQHTF
jgi:phytoene dehydrogenase-like protein